MQKLTLPLEIGKKYICRDGTVVLCDSKASIKNWAPGLVHIVTKEHTAKGTIWADTGLNGLGDRTYDNDVVADYDEPVAHPHAEAMMEYAKDAAKSVTPWLNWEYKHPQANWRELRDHPIWEISYAYRRKQPKVIINGIECVAGVKEPVFDELYYVSSITRSEYYWTLRYTGAYKNYVDRGLVHRTKEDAIAMARAMLNFQTA